MFVPTRQDTAYFFWTRYNMAKRRELLSVKHFCSPHVTHKLFSKFKPKLVSNKVIYGKDLNT